MLNYAVYLKLQQEAAKLSSLTQYLKKSPGQFAENAEKFLSELQALADAQLLPISSDIAIALQKIISFDGREKETGARYNARKERDKHAVSCLEDLQEKLRTYLDKYSKIFDESADVCRGIAAQIETFGPGTLSGPNAVDVCMETARREEVFKPYYAHVLGVLGFVNMRAVFDSVLPQIIYKRR